MRRVPLIAGNWKMNKTPSEARAWLEPFAAGLADDLRGAGTDAVEVLLCVPTTHLSPMAAAGTERIVLGGQDLSPHDEGAYTGEVSGAMLRDAGASYVVVGHSERRAYHGEDDAAVNAKVAAALRHGLRPILCIGESGAERDAGRAEEVVLTQLRGGLEGIDLADPDAPDRIVIAYEPVWAIGTGATATADDAQEMGAAIRAELRALAGDAAERMRVLYGGSMKPGNAAELIGRPDVDGGLIGGASLDADDLRAIVRAALEVGA